MLLLLLLLLVYLGKYTLRREGDKKQVGVTPSWCLWAMSNWYLPSAHPKTCHSKQESQRGDEERKKKQVWACAPNRSFSLLLSLKIRRSKFLNCIKLIDRRTSRLWNCEILGQGLWLNQYLTGKVIRYLWLASCLFCGWLVVWAASASNLAQPVDLYTTMACPKLLNEGYPWPVNAN